MKSPVMPSLQRPAQPASTTTGGVPLPLVGVIGPDLADITWDQVTTGIWTAPVPLSETANGELHLLKLAPGVTQPSARSSGSKLAIVLAGSYLDGDQTYLPGDVADLDDQAHHQIAADAKTGCICLIAADR